MDQSVSGKQTSLPLSQKSHGISSIIHSAIARSNGQPFKLSPGTAQRILDEANFHGQRSIADRKLHEHLFNAKNGTWDGRYPLAFCEFPDGNLWLVDGQHRCMTIVMHAIALPVSCIIFKVETEEEARKIYAGFDKVCSVRSTAETLDALDVASTLGIKKVTANALYRAVAVINNGMEPDYRWADIESNVSGARLKALDDWSKEAKEFDRITKSATNTLLRKLRGAGCFAVFLYTLRYQPGRAEDFWKGLCDNDGLRRNDPRSALLSDLTTRTFSTGSNRQTVQAPVMAWNAYCEGRDLKFIKCVEGAQIIIWGTPIGKAR